ncbi:MAG: diguanylate cyclase [Clostridiaceae bacterium]|nr:diguanylate cyclase [Clostridiaceae bacterium]
MNDNFYKRVMEESSTGYAYHKIICDEEGIPCDYKFIEVNAAFEKLTGLKSSNVIGKKISSILSNITQDESHLIHVYGDIAINGGKKEFEQFSESSKRWYKITVYSPEKYYFVTNFIDITKEMSQFSEMERLIQISEEFLQTNEEKTGYEKISDDFLKICGAKYGAISLFNEEEETFTTVAISGDKGLLKKVSRIIGFNMEERKWNLNQVLHKKTKGRNITHLYSLREFLDGIIPKSIGILLEKTFNIGEVILIKILKKDIMLGYFTLCMSKGENFNKYTMAEVYTRQLGMLISRKRAEDELLHEKILTDAIFYSAPGMLYLYDDQGRLLRWNKKHHDITGYSSQELSKMSLWDWYNGDEKSRVAVMEGLTKAVEEGFGDGESELRKKDGTTVPMYFTASALYLDDKQYFAGIAIDITERKKKEEEIFYLSYHDHLTGLYNRRFYEEELKRLDTKRNLPMTIIMGDVNGLKLINDSFGHFMGDELIKKVAEVIRQGCRGDDIIARLGGDEFVIILPKTDAFETEQIIKRITKLSLSEKVGSIDISISFGYETKKNKEEKIEDIFKNAEDHMYKKKLLESPSMRGKTIKAIINTLHEKNKREEQHSHRVSSLCKSMGEALGLPDYKNEELKLVGLLHDIGKIAIDENVLNKPAKLTQDEWKEIKRHPEIGYRILNTVNDMSDMAKYVLYHHERWDGKGYPKGLKGQEIPYVSRIITIVDAYDAMTSERSYRSALPMEVVIDELQRNSGIQFDPELVAVFIEKILNSSNSLYANCKEKTY